MIFDHQASIVLGLTGLLLTFGRVSTVESRPVDSEASKKSRDSEGMIHLYGEAPQPNQLRQSYLVFQQYGGQVIGAYYQPRSEFDCFIGALDRNELDISILNFRRTEVIETQVALDKLYTLPAPGKNDARMLNICQQELLGEGLIEQPLQLRAEN